MLFSASSRNRLRVSVLSVLFVTLLFTSLLSFAQVNLKYRMLAGYLLNSDAPVNKSKPTLFVFEQPETFGQAFTPANTGKRTAEPNFSKEMIIGIAIPASSKPRQLAVSKVFVQDSTLTVRYISMADTTLKDTQSPVSQPLLLLAIPKQAVLKTRLVENGKVIQTIKKRESGE